MRLVTRGDLDGLVAAVLLTTVEDIGSIELIHPQDITNDRFEITGDDVMANLPYHPGCGLWFDHHEFTESNRKPLAGFRGAHALAPSVARVIYDYYGPGKLGRFAALVAETDRFDSAQLTMDDVTGPKGVILLGFTIDPRSGIGAFKDYFMGLAAGLREGGVEAVLKRPDVAERAETFLRSNAEFKGLLLKHSRMEGAVVITDFRGLDRPPVGNRFLVYTLFPGSNVSVRLQWGPNRQFVATTIGHSIFNRTCRVNIGHLCSDYGGGGHRGAGACPIPADKAETLISELIERLKKGC